MAASSCSLQPRARRIHAPLAGDHQPMCRLGTTCRWRRCRPAATRDLDLQLAKRRHNNPHNLQSALHTWAVQLGHISGRSTPPLLLMDDLQSTVASPRSMNEVAQWHARAGEAAVRRRVPIVRLCPVASSCWLVTNGAGLRHGLAR
ncbi:hypothetical protein VPH35_088087 [Triticum aestivum]